MRTWICGLGLLVCSCGSGQSLDLPSQAEIDAAKQKAALGVGLAERGRQALEMLGLFPTYECGEPRRTFVGRIVEGFWAEHDCGTLATEERGAEKDAVTITFPAEGCQLLGTTLSGQAAFVYAGGTDRFSLEADFAALVVDGEALQMSAGYGTCGDEKRFWAEGQGDVPGAAGLSFRLDVTVGLRAGLPVIGSSTILFDGTAELRDAAGVDRITMDGVEYELGGLLPREGLLRIETADGTRIDVRFSSGLLFGKVELTIDDHDPVSVPIL